MAGLADLERSIKATQARLRDLQPVHVERVLRISRQAQAELTARLRDLAPGRFTTQRVRAVLAQVNTVVDELGRELGEDLGAVVEGIGRQAAPIATDELLSQFQTWAEEHPTAARAAVRLEEAGGALRPGLLEHFEQSRLRYGDRAISDMRDSLSLSYLSDETTIQASNRLADAIGIEDWRAERIVRTEQSNAYHVQWLEEAQADLGPAADEWRKQLVATFDPRTGEDSKFVDGQERPLDGEFEDNEGRKYRQPPNRPNDRETVILVPAS